MLGGKRRFVAAIALTGASIGGLLSSEITPVGAVSGPMCSAVDLVAPGHTHALAVRDDTTAYGWGDNSKNQLTISPNSKRLSPEAIESLTGAAEVAAGSTFTVARFPTGSVKAAGANTYGQLGNGSTTDSKPLVDTGLSNVVAIDAGAYHSVALKSDGTVWAWGRNTEGQVGDGTFTNRTTPTQVSGLANVVSIAAGWQHSLAIKSDGTLWTWGLNFDGQLGDGTKVNRSSPVQVSGITTATTADGSTKSSIVLLQDKTIRTWGANSSGQLGIPGGTKTTPQTVSLTNVTHVSLGAFHALARTQDGKTWAWGANQFGQLGTGTPKVGPPVDAPPAQSTTPVEVAGATGAIEVAAGGHSSYAVRGSKTLWAWGNNANGQLGIGTTTDSYEPVQTGCPQPEHPVPFAVALVAEPPAAAPGTPIVLHAVANQDVVTTPYAIHIFDDQSGLLVVSCATGMTCSAPVTSATSQTKTYTAYIGSPSATAPPAFTQAQSQTTVTWGPGGVGPNSASCAGGTTVHNSPEALVQHTSPNPDETWVCFRVANRQGGRVAVVAPSISPSIVTVDQNTAECAKPGNDAPGPHPLVDDTTEGTPYTVDTYAKGTAASVCVTVGDTLVRVGVAVSGLPPGVVVSLDGF